MVAVCPKCKVRLKIADEKIAPEGSRFKCPKCSTVLLIKRPKAEAAKAAPGRQLDKTKVIIAHAEASVIERVKAVLLKAGYNVITSTDGVDAMIKILRVLPHLAIIDVALPKIYGFEICKRLRERQETKGMRMVLVSSVYDKKRYKREPVSLYGADDYIDEHEIEASLLEKIKTPAVKEKEAPVKAPEGTTAAVPPPAAPPPAPAALTSAPAAPPSPRVEAPRQEPAALKPAVVAAPKADDMVEKAKRLVRIILSDIYLYSAQKVEEAVKNNKFREAFAGDLKEGLKLFNQRVSEETRKKGDFYNEEIDNFIETRKKSLGIK